MLIKKIASLSDFLEKKGVQYFIIGLIVCGVLLVVFNPSIGPLQQGANFAVHITLAYLIAGMFFLIINNKNLMLASLGACVILCLFLKGSSNSSFLFPQINRGVSIKIAHIDLSAATGSHDEFMKSILRYDADVVSFQEVDLGWSDVLKYYLEEAYPFVNKNITLDHFGMAVYSKVPFVHFKTLSIEDHPTLLTTVSIGSAENSKSVSVLSSYTLPNFDSNFRTANKRYFAGLAQHILKSTTPVINLGKYNLTYWSNELITFKNQANLEHSRRDAVAAGLDPPMDHIYYTEQLECTEFREILDSQRNHLGIIGNYQFKELDKILNNKDVPTVERF